MKRKTMFILLFQAEFNSDEYKISQKQRRYVR